MFAAVLAFGLTLGGRNPACAAPLNAACANSRQLVSNKDFQATLHRFLGDGVGNYRQGSRALFKDTTLVFVVGIFDFLKTIEAARTDPTWATPVTSTTGYAFAAIF